MTSAHAGMYYDFSIPLGLVDLLFGVIANTQNDPNTPEVSTPSNTSRMWFSQPRPAHLNDPSPVTEVLTINFKLPLSVSELGWDALRVSCQMQVWYQDRQNNWRQVLDESRVPVTLNLASSTASAWYTAHFYCYPIVAKALQFRFTRAYDPAVGNAPFCVGMRNGLIRRNIYTRSDGTQGIEPQEDPMGNTFTAYIEDWDASQAIDNHPSTYWKCFPQPSSSAVVSMYLDCRSPAGGPQLIDTLYIDPVYSGQNLNLYYSNDDTQGTLKLSPVGCLPTTDENTLWTDGAGRSDVSTVSPPGTSNYQFPFSWGPLVNTDAWVGIEWAMDFNPTSGPPTNPILFQITPEAPVTGQYTPTIYYDVGGAEIVLELTDGTTTKTYLVALSPLPKVNTPLRIVAAWGYTPATVFLKVCAPDGTVLGSLINNNPALPSQMTFDGSMGFTDFRGLFTAHVVKLENWTVGLDSFMANAQIYVSPDPVQPDPSGNVPTTTLDNSIFAAAWAMQEVGTGGSHESVFQAKSWTPIWSNYFTEQGNLFFPSQINLKYLKLEFSNLTQESYPVYDSGIQTTYNTFPVSVTSSSVQPLGQLGEAVGLLALGADLILGGANSVNWLNPQTVNNAVNSIFGQTVQPMTVTAGVGQNTTTLPNTVSTDLASQTRTEVSSPWVYKRSSQNSSTLAGNIIDTATTSSSVQGLTSSVPSNATSLGNGITWTPSTNAGNSSSSALPVQGADYWVFPGGTLKMPATVMNGLTGSTEVDLGPGLSTITRYRFTTTSVHVYSQKTVTLDAAMAYFAGMREVQPYVTTYIASEDPVNFTFSQYDASQWVLTNISALDSGPITTAGAIYNIDNPEFDMDIGDWTAAQGTWTWDGSLGHFYPGTATVTADGTEKELLSDIVYVSPGAHLDMSVWVSWTGLTATSGSEALQLVANYYLGDTFISSQAVGLTYSPWASSTPSVGGNPWAQIVGSLATSSGFTVPDGVDRMLVGLMVTPAATEGQVWFDTVGIETTDTVEGTAYKDFITTSSFAKLYCTFHDSGLSRSDSMWAAPTADTNVSSTALAYYTNTIPDVIPAGMWGDTFADWGDITITWGEPEAVVAIQVDPDRIYDSKRVLHFTRAKGAGEAGITVRQSTNYVANGLFRIGCVFYKPTANNNQITLNLRRVSDGVYIHSETFTPTVGYWYNYVSSFIEIPASEDQVYTVELVCSGDDADELYLNDLYTEVAAIRYFVQLGGSGAFLHDVTALAYAGQAIVSVTTPVNEFSVEATILDPRAYSYGGTFTPVYLK